MHITEVQATEMFSPELREAITRFRRALTDHTLVLVLRQENARQFPGSDAPSVEDLAHDIFGRYWNNSAFKVEFRYVIERVPSLLALNGLLRKVVDGHDTELMPLIPALPLDASMLSNVTKMNLPPRPYQGMKLVIDYDHCQELIKLFQETRSEK